MRGRGLLAVAALAVATAAFLLFESGAVRVSREDDSTPVRLLEPRATHTRVELAPIVPQPIPNLTGDGVTRIKGVVTGPDGSIWGVKVLLRSTDPEHKEPLGEAYTGASGGFEFALDFAALPSSEVFMVAKPDDITHLKPASTDPFVVLRGHTTEVDVAVGGVHRIRGNVRRGDGSRIPAGLDICAVRIDRLESGRSVAHGTGARAISFPADPDQPSARIRPNGDFSVRVGSDGTYRLYCRSTRHLLECGAARPGVPVEALLSPACGVQADVWDLSDVENPRAAKRGRYMEPMPIQVRFESSSGETFYGFGRTDHGRLFLQWPRPAWWRASSEVTVFVESFGTTAKMFPRRRSVYRGLSGVSLHLHVIPPGKSARSSRFDVRRGGEPWGGPLDVLFVRQEPFEGGSIQVAHKCVMFEDAKGGWRVVLPDGSGRLILLSRGLAIAERKLGSEQILSDHRFELPAPGSIELEWPEGAKAEVRVVSIRRKGVGADWWYGTDWGLKHGAQMRGLMPGAWIVTDLGKDYEVDVRAAETTTLVIE